MSKSPREINFKPSCLNEMLGLPADQNAHVLEKIQRLQEDPIPDGKLKKKLKGSKEPLYRLRSGNYRIFYRFGDTWVRLLAIRKRDDSTYKGDVGESSSVSPEAPPGDDDENIDEILAAGEKQYDFTFKKEPKLTPLPRAITEEWLKELKIPIGYFSTLIPCKSEEELLGCQVPQSVIGLLIDNLFPKPLDEVENQPDLIVKDTSDLIRYKEGELLAFLLKLDADQQKLSDWALKGPTLVKGGAGTGKSTVALYRVKSLLEGPRATSEETVLFTTYTRALKSASSQLLEQLLTEDQFARVRVATCDEIAYEIASNGQNLGTTLFGPKLNTLFRKVRAEFAKRESESFEASIAKRKIATLDNRYLLEEFEWIIDGRGITSWEEYKAAKRPGRGIGFRETIRAQVWELYQSFKSALRDSDSLLYADIRNIALAKIRNGSWAQKYDFIVVDEAQDLAPVTLSMMAELAVSEEGLFCAADNKQSLYSRNYSWTSAHPRLQFKGRTALLKRNYRSTAEIDRAAFDILTAEQGEELETSESVHRGPIPVILKGTSREEEGQWIARFIRQMSSHLRMKTNASAVLTFTKREGERLAEQLKEAGLAASFFEGKDLDLKAETVKVLTLHSAKGLEFPVVAVGGICTGSFPNHEDYDDEELYEEHMRTHRRLIYVGMTRAMRGLAIVIPEGCENEALTDIESNNWHIETISQDA